MNGLPPPPGGIGGLPPPPSGIGGLPPPPGGMGSFPPPPGFGYNRGITPLSTGLPPSGGNGLPPPPGAFNGLPPPIGQFGSGRGLGTGLPPPPGGSNSGLPPPPNGSTSRFPLPPTSNFNSGRGLGTTLPPPPNGSTGLPPPPGGSTIRFPLPPTSNFNSDRGLGTTLPPSPNGASGLLPPPGGMVGLPPPPVNSGGLPPLSSLQQSGGFPPPPMSTGLNSGRGITPLSTGLLPPPGTGELPPPPGGAGLPLPPPGTGGLPPPPLNQFGSGRIAPPSSEIPLPVSGIGIPPMTSYQSGRIAVTTGQIPPTGTMAQPGFAGPAPPPQLNSMNFQSQMSYQSNMIGPTLSTMGPRMGPPVPSMTGPRDDLGPETSLLKTCKVCSKPCKDKYIFAFGNCYCPGCLNCSMLGCQKPLSPPEIVMYKENPICLQCAKVNGKLNRCPVCQEFLINNEDIITIRDLNLTIHADCLRCCECSCKLQPSNYQIIKDQICCESCKHLAQQRACRECQEPILGRFVYDRSHFFHIDCFRCSECDKQLSGKNFVVHHNRYYCPEQGIRYLKTCSYCKNEISMTELNKLRWQNKWYHKRCFVCRICGIQLETKDAFCCHNRPHCKRCFDQRVKEGDVTESGRTPSNHEHAHKPSVSRQLRERFMKKFGDEKFRMPKYANEEEKEKSDSVKMSKHSSKKGSGSGHSSRKGSGSSHREHESHKGHRKSSSSSSDHYKSHRSHRSRH